MSVAPGDRGSRPGVPAGAWHDPASGPTVAGPDDDFDEDLFADLPTAGGDGRPAGPGPSAGAPGGRSTAPGSQAGVEDLLRQAVEVVASARRAPLSASVLVPRDDLLEILQRALEALPEELRQARWLLRERDEFLAQRQREADELIETVRAQAERMVQRTEIVRQANHVGQRLVEEAREEARRLRHEAEDFCDQKLAEFEVVLERTARTVRAGRERLAAPAPPVDPAPDAIGGRGGQGRQDGTYRFGTADAGPGALRGTGGGGHGDAPDPGADGDPLFDQDRG